MNSGPAPLVSVIVPTWNRPLGLREALDSLARQRFTNFETLVINDGGSDVADVVSGFAGAQPVRHLEHAGNRGPASARNTGLRLARGKYVAYLDDDDVYLPGHLETLVAFLESTGNKVAYTDACCARVDVVDGAEQTISREVPYSSDWDNERVLAANIAPLLCFMHARECVTRAGAFDETLSTHEDWEYWIRLSRIYPFHHLKTTTCEYRVRSDKESLTWRKRSDCLVSAHRIYARYRALSSALPAVVSAQNDLLAQLEKEVHGRVLSPSERASFRREVCPDVLDAGDSIPVRRRPTWLRWLRARWRG
jgi:glycosyltransferase involved in cell wall biosynthesis